ncbi:MAG: hypothetical protein AAF652_18485, partial [Cyanobacteria bacterium P01_C01_bin.72]
ISVMKLSAQRRRAQRRLVRRKTISEGVPQGPNISFRTGKAQPHSGQIALSELDAKHRPYALLAFKKNKLNLSKNLALELKKSLETYTDR